MRDLDPPLKPPEYYDVLADIGRAVVAETKNCNQPAPGNLSGLRCERRKGHEGRHKVTETYRWDGDDE